MYHQLQLIAVTHRFDKVKFVDYAVTHADRYGVILWAGDLASSEVSTWHADKLVNDFRILTDLAKETSNDSA